MRENLTRDEASARAGAVRSVGYEVELDLTETETFRSRSLIRFAADPGAATFLECAADRIVEATLNGRPATVDGHRILLEDLAERNEVRVIAEMPYRASEYGITRFVDPVDGEPYLYSDAEPYGSHRIFASFNQPDLKARVRMQVVAPSAWEVASNMAPDAEAEVDGDARRWSFRESPPLPTYLVAVVAGPYHIVRDRHRDVELGVWCRRSLAEHLDPGEILEVTKQGFDFFEEAFGHPYAFGKYDQVFVPEYAAGAMENPGLVTFNEMHIYRARVTEARRERRAETILHELAHMWFGDLVTMRWWDDLWLNETFATYAAALACERATRFTEPWTTFAHIEKPWAARQDQLPTTHPIVADVPDIESVFLNFDGITYAKGASVMRQLVAWVGLERFLEGMSTYFERHAFGNATLEDFLAVHQEASGRDLQGWADVWLRRSGMNTLRPSIDGGRLTIEQEGEPARPHRLAVGAYAAENDKLVRRARIELDVAGDATEVPDLDASAADLILINDEDLTYAKVRFDDRSLQTIREGLSGLADPLSRGVVWRALWDLTRDGEWPAREYLATVLDHISIEVLPSAIQPLISQAHAAAVVYGDPANRTAAMGALAAASLEGMRGAEPGSDPQLIWARAFIDTARSAEHLDLVARLLDGDERIEGLAIDTDLRWHIVRALAAAGADDGRIDAEELRDPTDEGRREAAAARAAIPTAEAKGEAWTAVAGREPARLTMTRAILGGFQQPDQEEILGPFADRYFDEVPDVFARSETLVGLSFAKLGFPRAIVSEATLARTDALLAGDLPGQLRRVLLEGKDELERVLRGRERDRAAGRDG